jgi:hypothetical protein
MQTSDLHSGRTVQEGGDSGSRSIFQTAQYPASRQTQLLTFKCYQQEKWNIFTCHRDCRHCRVTLVTERTRWGYIASDSCVYLTPRRHKTFLRKLIGAQRIQKFLSFIEHVLSLLCPPEVCYWKPSWDHIVNLRFNIVTCTGVRVTNNIDSRSDYWIYCPFLVQLYLITRHAALSLIYTLGFSVPTSRLLATDLYTETITSKNYAVFLPFPTATNSENWTQFSSDWTHHGNSLPVLQSKLLAADRLVI